MAKYDIYGIGAALVDTEIEVTDQDLAQLGLEKGVMTLVDADRQQELVEQLTGHLVASTRASGGSGANSIIAASYLGAKTFYSCKVADDENGEFYLKDLADAGVEYHGKSAGHDGITGKCLVMITPDAERTMTTFLGVSEGLSSNEIDQTALQQSSWAYIEGYLVTSATGRPAAKEVRRLAADSGVRTAISLSDPAIVRFFKSGLQEIIGDGVDLLFCNKAEALEFTGAEHLEEAVEQLRPWAKQMVITQGADGALLFDGSTLTHVPGTPVKAVDTNGAGDMFAGSFLYGLSQGMSFPEAGQLANRAAAKVVSQYGPRLRPEQHDELKR
jgi:sugar/nucleoside kinase (ribokinase family)